MVDQSDNSNHLLYESARNENIEDSDSDLFGESESVSDRDNDNNNLDVNLNDVNNIKNLIESDLVQISSSNLEEVNHIKLNKPTNYFGMEDDGCIFLSLKLPKRLKVLNVPNTSNEIEDDGFDIKGGIFDNGEVYSNSRLISWSDGTFSLFINNNYAYDCIIGYDKAFIFDDSLDPKYKFCLGKIDHKLTIRPRTLEKNKLFKNSKSRVMIPTTLEEINRSEVESRKREDELVTIASIKLQQKYANLSTGTKKKRMTSHFLEESSDESE
ncbi:Leo1-like protein [Cryptosporidium felis]|nr:Leo1-like protein [Cryptosporidium felis]